MIRIYGTDARGASVACFVQNFKPFFYVQVPEDFTDEFCGQFQQELNGKVLQEQKGQFKDVRKVILDVELCMKGNERSDWLQHKIYYFTPLENIYGYSSKGKQKFLKITIAFWQLMTSCKNVLERGMDVETANGRSHKNFNSFESNIDYEIRYMVDCKVRGASWITIPKGKHGARLQKETTCSYECTVDYRDIIPHEPEGEWANIAPMRILRYVRLRIFDIFSKFFFQFFRNFKIL